MDYNPEKFSVQLRKIRKYRGLSQAELAERVGVTQKMISYYECGKRYPSIEVARQLSLKLSVSSDYLLGIGDDYDIEDYVDISLLSKRNRQIFYEILQIIKENGKTEPKIPPVETDPLSILNKNLFPEDSSKE